MENILLVLEQLQLTLEATPIILAGALEVEPEHFREYRIRVITEKLEAMPELIDRLYKRLA